MTDKAEENPNNDLAQRRERGRLAQRAFRQRQIDTIRALNDENQELKDAIERIARAVSSSSNGMTEPDLQAAIQHARQVAKVDGGLEDVSSSSGYHSSDTELNPLGRRTSAPDNCANPNSFRPHRQSLPSTTPADITTSTIDPTALSGPHSRWFAPTSPSPSPTLDDLLDTDWPLQSSYPSAPIPIPSCPFPPSPRLPYNLVCPFPSPSPRTPKVTTPPPDIIPYLGPVASQTFAGHLFWASLTYAYRAVRAAIRLPSPSPSSSPSSPPLPITNAHLPAKPITHPAEDARAVFASVLQYTTLPQLHDLLHARLLFRRQGWVPADHPAARDPDAWIRLHALILQRENVDIGAWWAPVDVEAYVRSRMVAEHGMIIRTLVSKGRCFGDGPRFSAALVREVVDAACWREEGGGLSFSG